MNFRRVSAGLLLLLVGTAQAEPIRLDKQTPPGQRAKLSLGTLFVPEGVPAEGDVPLFLHFHGPGWIAESAASTGRVAVISMQLGTGSAVYGKPFTEPERLGALLAEARKKSGRNLKLVGLSGWSAGYGAVRAILRHAPSFDQVRWVLLLDGLHAGYRTDVRGIPRDEDIAVFVRFAREAAAGRKRFLITHTAIVPSSYASTTECANHILAAVGQKRGKPAGAPPSRLPVLGEARQGGLTVLGCAGTTAAAHIDHVHALAALLPLVLEDQPAVPLRCIDADAGTGSSRAVLVEEVPLAHTTQLLPPVAVRGKKVDEQVQGLLGVLDDTLKKGRSGLDQAVRLHFYASRDDVVPAIHRVLAKRFTGTHRPALTVVVGVGIQSDALVSADAVAVSTLAGKAGEVHRLGSVAVLPAGGVDYIAGQAERDPTLAGATRKTLASLDTTLRFLGRTRGQVVQVKAFMHPMAKTDEVRREIEAWFGKERLPAVTLVEWTMKNSIEIELVVAGPRDTRAEAIEFLTPPGMKASPIYSRVARVNHGKRIYTSGLYGEGRDGTAEVKDLFATLRTVLAKAGSDFKHLAKATYYVSTDDASKELNRLRPDYYDAKRPPSASKAPVQGVGRKGRGIVLDMIAVPMPERRGGR